MNYLLAVFDLDGTLTNSRKQVTPASRRAITAIMDRGVSVALASGRPTCGIMPVAEALGLDRRGGYILAYNGGVITDCRTGDVLYSSTLRRDVLPELADAARRSGTTLITYRGGDILTENPDDEYVQEEAHINAMRTVRVDNLVEAVDFDPPKCLITGHPRRLVPLEDDISEAMDGRLEAYRSAPYFLEVVPVGIDKALSLNRLLAHLGLSPQDMVAFGDGYNDFSMLRLAGVGVAMGNAAPEVRAVADYVTADNDHEGIAQAIARFFPDAAATAAAEGASAAR